MRQVLFRIPWEGLQIAGWKLPLFGFGLLFWFWVAVAAVVVYQLYFRPRLVGEGPGEGGGEAERLDLFSVGFWLLVAIGILRAPTLGPQLAPEGLPIFGYGAMLLCGVLAAVWLASRRAQAAGLPPEIIWDLAMWIFLPGIVGARLFYLLQYHERVFAGSQSTAEFLWRAVNLSDGGIVFYGGAIAGAIAFFTFCSVYRLPPLTVADIVTPSVFIGVGFGRLGCFLNGCCFGDACSLPWGVEFPAGTGPFDILVFRGFVPPDAAATPPLHPTQIYSSIDGFLIAGLTLWYSRWRRVPGDVLALGLLMSSITRFLIEFIRGDEFGQFGTTLTISQWISLGLLATAIGLMVYLNWRAKRLRAGSLPEPAPPNSLK